MRQEFQVLDRIKERSPVARYDVIVGSMDAHPDAYEFVTQQEDNPGYLSVYRDLNTTATVSVEFNQGDLTSLVLVGEGETIENSLAGVKSLVSNLFDFKLMEDED